jgi:hypothetical protein
MDKIRAFQILRQGPDESPLMFKERFMKTLEGMKQLGFDICGNVDQNYSQANLALRYTSRLDPGRYLALTIELENDVTKGNGSYPTTLLEAYNLA